MNISFLTANVSILPNLWYKSGYVLKNGVYACQILRPTTTFEWKLDPEFSQRNARGGLGFRLYDGETEGATVLHEHNTTFETGPGSVTVNGTVKKGFTYRATLAKHLIFGRYLKIWPKIESSTENLKL